MATHHCIGNPCWICYPEYAPKQDEKLYSYWQERMQDYSFKENKISSLLEEMLIRVFESGIDEDEHFRCNEDITLEKIKEERSRIPDDTLEAKLLDIMIKDFEFKEGLHS